MEAIYENLGGVFDLWGNHKNLEETSIEVTEIWSRQGSSKPVRATHKINIDEIDSWIATVTKGPDGQAETLLARFAWIRVSKQNNDKVIHPSTALVQKLIDGFGLGLAHKYAKTLITGIVALPRVDLPDSQRQAYSLSYVPKLATSWSQTRFTAQPAREPITSGIFFVDGDEYILPLNMALTRKWPIDLYKQAMFPAFCIFLAFSGQVSKVHEAVKTSLREIEGRTGYHDYKRSNSGVPTEDLSGLSRTSNALATKLASVSRKTKAMEKLMDFMQDEVKKEIKTQEQKRGGGSDLPSSESTLLHSYLDVVQERLAMQILDSEYTLKRVEIQIEALFHLVSANDTLTNLALAKATHRDASSMKTLAVVTMLFLPGSFVSALFSTDCFRWDGINPDSGDVSVPVTPQFWLYWAITIPLTVVTFVFYFLWLWYQKNDRKGQQTGQMTPDQDSDHYVRDTLASLIEYKRRSTMLPSREQSISSMWGRRPKLGSKESTIVSLA
ncbi:hypothetical protein B0I35DRAFT_474628 [Stachybotrys elegans]|uniref:Uncharacterized protein n=1 Tax=Stachybotrys elegans TaxID=80388 RepID=A0A8K0SVD9_9HYPO|nr:hypothetical protein B0I35DRAFT_474628 [Stachybotrys elegans]